MADESANATVLFIPDQIRDDRLLAHESQSQNAILDEHRGPLAIDSEIEAIDDEVIHAFLIHLSSVGRPGIHG
jgi:hypothetical protein